MKPKTISIISATGEVEERDAKAFFADKEWFKKLQEIVGGYVEVVRLGKVDMAVNEEGRLIGLPFNQTATHAAQQVIVGNAVLIPAGRL